MSNNAKNNSRIAKNTFLLYFRMLFIMAISLYTSRIILATLGIEDFGIYNVVGGIVTMFSFINSAMSSSTQRYITFELGKNNFDVLKKVFCTSVNIHFFIAIIIFILAETIGLWFLYNKMTIPDERMSAALWVYQGAVASTLVLIVSVPYNAAIIAHEKMSAFAYISVLEVVLKLLIVFVLSVGNFDKLKIYAVLMFVIQLIIRLIYGRYCKKHFPETKYYFASDWKLFKEMLRFAAWNLWGNCAGIASTQGVNILLNIFFGPTVNAARAVAIQVQNAVNQFYYNFQTAINPQITKSYAQKDYIYMHKLIFKSAKITYFLLLFLSVPIFLGADTVLALWLKNVPEHSVFFLRMILCISIIDATANPLMTAAAATGNVKLYQSIIGGILLAILPVSYIVLKLGAEPESVFIVHLSISIIAFITRLLIIKPMISLPLKEFIYQVIIKCIIVTLISLVLPLIIIHYVDMTFINFVTFCICCLLSIACSIYLLGLDMDEKFFIKNKVLSILYKSK